MQILTIEVLLRGQERPRYPDMAQGSLTFKKATTQAAPVKQETLF